MCEGELFFHEFSASTCTAFLVAPQILVTAGHCLQKYCNTVSKDYFMFDFNREFLSTLLQTNEYFEVPKANIYTCNKVLEHYFEPDVFVDIEQNDYAVVLLDRPVIDRPILEIRKYGKIENDTPLVTIGHPSGLPTIISDNASVKQNTYEHYFSADLDAVRGNSGGPVFNEKTEEVEGILVRVEGLRGNFLLESSRH